MKYVCTLLLMLSAQFALAASYHDEINAFFVLFEANKPGDATESLYSTNPWMKSNKDEINNVKDQLDDLGSGLGELKSKLMIDETRYREILVNVTYLLLYDRQPIRFTFHFYKPDDAWKIFGFTLDAEFDVEFDDNVRRSLLNQF